jgi:hypothetical protein
LRIVSFILEFRRKGFAIKHILLFAHGTLSKHFIEWVHKNRVAENSYYIVCQDKALLPENMAKHMHYRHFDPTSYSKILHILQERDYTDIFIVMENEEEAQYTLRNIRMLDEKVRIVLANRWDGSTLGQGDEYTHVIYTKELLAAHLYDHLPNVPVIAQNVGLAKGEIMEVLVPFGSTYAYRHVGSILQRKWKIAAIYRDNKQIIPTNATMVRPHDTLLIIGKPIVLDGIYKTVNKKVGLFPEPYGKNLYLLLNFEKDIKQLEFYLQQSLYLFKTLENKQLIIRIFNLNDFQKLEEMKVLVTSNKSIEVQIHYGEQSQIPEIVESDIQAYDIGLILNSVETFRTEQLNERLYTLHKMVYLFGDKLLYNIKEVIVPIEGSETMESISSTAFDVAEALNLQLTLADYNPEGDFEKNKMVVEHYETLTQIFNIEIHVEKKVANPIREMHRKGELLQIVPFEKRYNTYGLLNLVSSTLKDFVLTTKRFPKLLVPHN